MEPHQQWNIIAAQIESCESLACMEITPVSDQPWFKFWSTDYLCDPDVDKLPLDAQGLLVRMWCVCNLQGFVPDDLTGEVLNRVDTAAFFLRFEEDTAVQYFYEPFLEAFDPELRKQLGVWYTPREIVRYMVERVDTVLRTELGLASGLADPNVYVLDPACGTGAYLVEVLVASCARDWLFPSLFGRKCRWHSAGLAAHSAAGKSRALPRFGFAWQAGCRFAGYRTACAGSDGGCASH